MASDLSNIIKDELANTLEQLLAKPSKIESVEAYDGNTYSSDQAIKVDIKFDFSGVSSSWAFFIPTFSATKFEYFMLSGMGDLKEHIDDEIADAVNEIVSNICGSIATSTNAQGFDDLKNAKFESTGSSIIQIAELESQSNLYTFLISLEDEKLPVFISFDDAMLPFIGAITGEESVPVDSAIPAHGGIPVGVSGGEASSIAALLGEDSLDNLKLLFNIKLKLSVRLGTKIFLLKDILRWDVGEIIELNQMVNEPLDILINGVKIGEGEAVIVENKFGLKIRNIGDEHSRLSKIGL